MLTEIFNLVEINFFNFLLLSLKCLFKFTVAHPVFFNTFNKIAVTQLPANNATTAINGFDIAGITNTPPDGTLDPTPNVKLIAPHTPHPIEVEATVRSKSFIAIGITPSEIIHNPIGNATLIASSS